MLLSKKNSKKRSAKALLIKKAVKRGVKEYEETFRRLALT
jgi:hypothetical protein